MSKHPWLYSILILFMVSIFFGGLAMMAYKVMPKSSHSRRTQSGSFFSSGQIGVIEILGPIFDSYPIMEEIQSYGNDDKIKAVVVRIDSPGGAVAPSQEVYEELKKLKLKKKVIISMGTVAASGGYYIAIAGDFLFASKGTITGSIGVIMENLGVGDALEYMKLNQRVLKSGDYKDVGSPFRDILPHEKEYLQSFLDNMYDQFTLEVSSQRKLPLDEVRNHIAQGKIYTGEQALDVGLIDGIGTLYDAIDKAKELAGLSQDAKVIWPYEEPQPFSWIGSINQVISQISKVLTVQKGSQIPLWMY